MKPVGLVRMNTPAGRAPADATILVSGPPRSGTSFVAAALHAAGLSLGEMIDHTVFEDIEISAALPRRGQITHAIDRHFLRYFDSRPLARLIATRNAAFPKWGFKRPNLTASLVGRSGKAMFRHPRLVMIFRDPVALAERVAIAQGIAFSAALRLAHRYNDLNLKTARRANIPTLLASYEKVVVKREAFFAELFDFCGLDVDPGDYQRINSFVDTAGKSYVQMAGTPIIGYLNRYTDGVLYGWCRIAGREGPESVDIYADDVLLATVRADEYRPSLRQAGLGQGHHGFTLRIDHLGLPDNARLRAVVSGTDQEVANSGRRLAEFKTGVPVR